MASWWRPSFPLFSPVVKAEGTTSSSSASSSPFSSSNLSSSPSTMETAASSDSLKGKLATGLSALGLWGEKKKGPSVTPPPTALPPSVPEKSSASDAASSSLSSSKPLAPEAAGFLQPPTDPMAPVQFENFGREYANLSQLDTFDGFRIEAGKAVNRYLQTSHSLFLGTSLRETGYIYQFGPNFALDDGSLLLMARHGLDGSVNGRLVKKVNDAWEVKGTMNSSLIDEQRNMYEAAVDYAAKDWATSNKIAWQGTWILNSSFSQVLSPRLQMGGELTWIASTGATLGGIGARYAKDKDVWNAQISRTPDFKSHSGLGSSVHSSKFQFFRKLSDRLSLGAEYEYSHPDKESAMRMGYEYTFRQARVQGTIDTAGKIAMTAQDASIGLGVSGTIDYAKGDYRFGFLMHIVPPPEPPQAPSLS